MTLSTCNAARCTLAAPLLAVLAVGCAEGPVKTDPAMLASLRESLVLASEPDGAVTPLEWREEREAAESDDSAQPVAEDRSVVLVGRVGGMPSPWGADTEPDFPFRTGEATFFLVDPATAAEFDSRAAEEGGDDHAADCPFCAREAANQASAVATVTVSQHSAPMAIDARELFELKGGDLVVVRGAWSLAGDALVVEADGVYRRN